jgi:hypothetical protein
MTSARVICAAMPFGYGPAAKLLSIARVLKARGARLTLAGRGIALELASRTPALFDEVLTAEAPPAVRRAAVRSATAALSVMDRELAQETVGTAVPLYVVDSLLWMRDAIPPAFHSAYRYWAQDFLGLRELQAEYQPAPSIVGPIVSPDLGRRPATPSRLLINLGGCELPEGADPSIGAYADFVVAGFLQSGLAKRFADRTTVMAGSRRIATLRASHRSDGIEFVSLPHEAALEELGRAALVLTSPGLTMTLESFQRGAPTFFLPPQNYSQWCALRLLRRAGLAPHALHWEDLSPSLRLGDRMPESQRNPVVRAAIASFATDDEARARFADCLGELDRSDHAVLVDEERKFLASLGPNGTLTIADEIAGRRLSPHPSGATAG